MPADDDMPDEIRQAVAVLATWFLAQARLRAGETMAPEVMADYADYTVDQLSRLLIYLAKARGIDEDAVKAEISKSFLSVAAQEETLQ